jgi:hypothetical protein
MKDYYIEVEITGVTPSGILYQRPPITQRTSYRSGDTGWAYANGYYDYSTDPINPAVIQQLDYTDTTNFFFKLKFNNAFGNKNRFTNSLGVNNNASGRLVGMSFTGALSNYVIDNLTGWAFTSFDNGSAVSWNGTIDSIAARRAASYLGYNDWIPVSLAQVYQSYSAHFINELPFGASAAFYFGETNSVTTTNSWRLVSSAVAASTKATTTNQVYAFTRKHF